MTQRNRCILAFLFLAFSLQPVQAYDFNLKTITEKISGWFQEKHLVPGIMIGAFVGIAFMYWFSGFKKKNVNNAKQQKKENEEVGNKGMQSNGKSPINDTETEENATQVFNIPVLGQQGSTCGYHTLKNALIFYNYAHTWLNEIAKPELTDEKYFQEKYDDWSKTVHDFRTKSALQRNVQNRLEACLAKGKPYTEEYRKILHNLGMGIADIALLEINQQNSSLYHCSSQSLISLIAIEKKLAENLKTPESLNEYFTNLYDIKITKEDIDKLNISNAEEINNFELNDLLLQATDNEAVRDHFTIIPDVDTFEATYGEEKWLQWLTTQDNFHAFLMGSMSEKNASQGRHWYLLAAQKKNNEVRYFVSDSMRSDNSKDERVQRIIKHLQG